METIDHAGLVLDAISEAFSAIVPPLAPHMGKRKEVCGALATALFGGDWSGRTAPDDEEAGFAAEDAFQIAQIFVRAEMGQPERSGGHPVYYFLQAAAIVAQRTAANPSTRNETGVFRK